MRDAGLTETLIVIDAPHFYAGVVLQDGRVVRFAPIVKYMRGWSRQQVLDYCRRKHWQVSER